MSTNTNSKVNAATANNFIMITVPTKTHDGGAKAASTSEPVSKRPRTPVRKHDDPFMYYSHQETRMHALFFHDENENDSVPNESAMISEPVVRKTRISFELHPTLLLEDLFLELENHHLGA
jgi:hypothetical protein